MRKYENYIQYIETQKSFPSEKVMECTAKELGIEPYKLFEVRDELKKDLQDMIDVFIDSVLKSYKTILLPHTINNYYLLIIN